MISEDCLNCNITVMIISELCVCTFVFHCDLTISTKQIRDQWKSAVHVSVKSDPFVRTLEDAYLQLLKSNFQFSYSSFSYVCTYILYMSAASRAATTPLYTLTCVHMYHMSMHYELAIHLIILYIIYT